MFLLVKEINGEDIIIGTAQKYVSVDSCKDSKIRVFEISDDEFNPDMIHAKIEKFEEED